MVGLQRLVNRICDARQRSMFARLPIRVLAAAVGLAAVWLVISTGHGVRAQVLKTIRTVVPYAPGGVADIIARLVAEEIGRSSGATVVVENRPGAGGVMGAEVVARGAADGNTLLVASTPFIIEPLLRKLSYDSLTSFAPLCYLVNAPTVIVVNSASPYRTLAQLLDDARAKPGQITMASIGPASSFQLGFEMLKRAAKVDMIFVPYPGNAPALDAVLGQQVTSMFGTYANVAAYLKAGTLRALAVLPKKVIGTLMQMFGLAPKARARSRCRTSQRLRRCPGAYPRTGNLCAGWFIQDRA